MIQRLQAARLDIPDQPVLTQSGSQSEFGGLQMFGPQAWPVTAGRWQVALVSMLVAASLLLSGCAGARSGGNYYLDDGPGKDDAKRLARLMAEPDPVPVFEKLLDRTNRPYRVMGQNFTPMTSRQPYRVTGVASWYGKRFHGRPTSTGEIYDMYQMTAAHPTLPLPSYARVKNLENGREVIVRVNDRGPFLRGRLIDLSYLAANKLGYVAKGHAKVEVELLNPQPGQRWAFAQGQQGLTGQAGQTAPQTQTQTQTQAQAQAQAQAQGQPDFQSQPQGGPALGGTVIRPASLPQPAAAGNAGLASQQPVAASPAVGSMTEAQVAAEQTGSGGQAGSAAPTGNMGNTRRAEDAGSGGEPAAAASKEVTADVGGGWFVQLGIFSALENALRTQRLQQAVSVRGDPPVEIIEQGERYQVLMGPFDDEQQARAAVTAIEQRTGQRPWVSFRR